MGASAARRVRAERARRRLPPRLRRVRWGLRLAGLLGTATLLGVGVAAALMIAPNRGGKGALFTSSPAATATPTPRGHRAARAAPKRPSGPTKAQLRQRAAAVRELAGQGYRPVSLSVYDPTATLRVLIGRPLANPAGLRFAFFFVGAHFIGRDAAAPSARVSVAASGRRFVKLAYRTCCPQARTLVRFRWDGGRLVTADPLPPPVARQTTGA